MTHSARATLRPAYARLATALFAASLLASCSREVMAPSATGEHAALQRGANPKGSEMVLVRMRSGGPPDSLANPNAAQVAGAIPELGLTLLRVPPNQTRDQFLESLSQNPNIEFAEPDSPVSTAEAGQSTVAFSEAGRCWGDVGAQYALARLGVTQAWERTRGEGVRVAILDTGIELDHPVLANALETGIEPGATGLPGNEIAEGVDTNQDGIVDGALGHGTHVAGIVHAVAPAAKLIPVRVLDSDGLGDVYRVSRGLVLAAKRGVHVVNLSLGLSAPSRSLQAALDHVRSKGIVVVAAAGNLSSTLLDYPASYAPVVSVAATDFNDRRASFSDYGADVDLAAPGDGILSSYWGGGYARWSGTSMAAPFVSGTAALLAASLGHDTASIVDMLLRGADPLTASDPDYAPLLGAGRVSAAGSVHMLPLPGENDEEERERHDRGEHRGR